MKTLESWAKDAAILIQWYILEAEKSGGSNDAAHEEKALIAEFHPAMRAHSKSFTVIAGKYDDICRCEENPHGENIKFSSEPLPFSQAVKIAKQYSSSNFCYIEYQGQRLTLS